VFRSTRDTHLLEASVAHYECKPTVSGPKCHAIANIFHKVHDVLPAVVISILPLDPWHFRDFEGVITRLVCHVFKFAPFDTMNQVKAPIPFMDTLRWGPVTFVGDRFGLISSL
jgi:hypothetical protein